jgi:undecaprenyl-phosphate galactose phosphotransferase/putative colanic acid biosynthesis UDP-glucose lipid carrier transferase
LGRTRSSFEGRVHGVYPPASAEEVSSAESLLKSAASGLLSYRTVGPFVGLLDVALIIGASVVGGIVYELLAFGSVDIWDGIVGVGNTTDEFFRVGIISAALFLLLNATRGLYGLPALLQLNTQIRALASGWIGVALAVIALLFLLKIGQSYSRGATLTFDIVALPLLLSLRIAVATKLERLIARQALGGDPTIVLGSPEELARLSTRDLLHSYGAREVGRFKLSPDTGRELDTVDAAIRLARKLEATKVLLALPWADADRRRLIGERLRSLPVAVMLLPDSSVAPILAQAKFGSNSKLEIEIQRAPLSQMEMAAKRACDVLIAGASILFLAPMIIVVGAVIALDSKGPVIFRQNRNGFNGRQFVIYKFRTLSVLENGEVVNQVKRDDDRVTRIGRVLRATSIDELPQLFNVLKGDMSLVGPRPHAIAHDNQYTSLVADYALRHHV